MVAEAAPSSRSATNDREASPDPWSRALPVFYIRSELLQTLVRHRAMGTRTPFLAEDRWVFGATHSSTPSSIGGYGVLRARVNCDSSTPGSPLPAACAAGGVGLASACA